MDYSVGSVAELISGTKTRHKPKLAKVPLKQKFEIVETEPSEEISEETKNVEIVRPKKRKIVEAEPKKEISEETHDVENVRPKKRRTSVPLILNKNESADDQEVGLAKKSSNPPTLEELSRTVFVGNVPVKVGKKKMKAHFKTYGPIESLRFRSVASANPKLTKKAAAIKKQFHPDRTSVNWYIRYSNIEDAQKALVENGAVFEEHHLRVQTCDKNEVEDESKAIFIGNLCFKTEEEELWKLFESCGPISHIRIVRDKETGMGKGFAYVNFMDTDAVQLALEMDKVKLRNRELRIKPSCSLNAKKNKKDRQNRQKMKVGQRSHPGENRNSKNSEHVKNSNMSRKNFQGSKFNLKKKHKNKSLQEKKRKIKKIAPISK